MKSVQHQPAGNTQMKQKCPVFNKERISSNRESPLIQANPRGVNFVVTVIVSFHPAGFITKNDRAFHVRCFYMEPDEIVTSSIDVRYGSYSTILSIFILLYPPVEIDPTVSTTRYHLV